MGRGRRQLLVTDREFLAFGRRAGEVSLARRPEIACRIAQRERFEDAEQLIRFLTRLRRAAVARAGEG